MNMISTIETLRQLTLQAREGDSEALVELQTRLHPGFVRVIRCVLRTGVGDPALTNWVCRAIQSLPESERANPCDTLARMLCNSIEFSADARLRVISSAETVIELAI
jgi:hypothetical protein